MAVRTITTKLAVDGESEYKKALGEVDRSLKTLKTEMGLADATFKGQANSAEALAEKHRILSEEVEQQEEKVRSLEGALEEASKAYGENDKRTDSYRQKLNRAKTELVNLNRELKTNDKYLEEAEASTDGCAKSIDGFGREVKDAAGKVDDFDDALGEASRTIKNADGSWNFGGIVSSLKDFKGMLAGGAVVTGVKELYGAIRDIVDESEEYRKIMGTLETSSAAAGYSAENTAADFNYLFGVLGDTQQAATTVANLQAVGASQEELRVLIDACIGAWATYGDSIPIDGLSEAVNETIQAAKVTGTFADVLNWAGTDEDEFNEKLAACADTEERLQLVLEQLTTQGLPDNAKAWRENNEDIVAYNEAQNALNAALGELGETLQPLVTEFTNFKASLLRELTPIISKVGELIRKIVELGNTPIRINQDPVDDRWMENFGPNSSGYRTITSQSGKFASGLDRVPYDNYPAVLHRDEMVLTSREADDYRNGEGGRGEPQTVVIHTHVELDKREVGRSVTEYQNNERRARGR